MTHPEFCVIGSGPAGAVVAVSLAGRGRRVLLLEAGEADTAGPATDGLDQVDVGGETELNFGRAFQLGGSSNLWAGRVVPLEPIDFTRRSWVPGSGWPIPHSELEPWFEQAVRLVGVRPWSELPTVIPRAPDGWDRLLEGGTAELKPFAWGSEPFRVGPWLKSRLPDLPTLEVRTGARVTGLVEAPDGRIAAARVRHGNGETREVAAGTFILAAGGVEVVRLLLAGRGRSGTGIGNQNDLVGRYFSTHPKADIALLKLNRRTPTGHPLFAIHPDGTGTIRAGVGVSREAQERLSLLNHYVQMTPLAEFRASRIFEFMRGSPAISSPFIDKSTAAKGWLVALGLLVFDGIGRLGKLQKRARKLILRAFLDQYPDPDNRITLSDRLDVHGVPKVNIRWRLTRRDKESVLRFLEVLDSEFLRHGIGTLDFERLRGMSEWPLTGLHSHFLGATRMGDDERTGVVDRHGRVHGVPNLYVSGPSLFPAYGYANPFLTIVALAYRMGEHLGPMPSPGPS